MWGRDVSDGDAGVRFPCSIDFWEKKLFIQKLFFNLRMSISKLETKFPTSINSSLESTVSSISLQISTTGVVCFVIRRHVSQQRRIVSNHRIDAPDLSSFSWKWICFSFECAMLPNHTNSLWYQPPRELDIVGTRLETVKKNSDEVDSGWNSTQHNDDICWEC